MGNVTIFYKKFNGYFVISSGIILFILLALLVSRYLFDRGRNTEVQDQLMQVERHSFRLHVIERGIVRPARITPVKSEISGNQAKLIWVLPEGTKIDKGLLIARFDSKPLMDILQKADQNLADAQAQWEDSLKALELLRESARSAQADMQRKLEIAEIKANDLKNGSGPLKRHQLEQVVTKATRNKDILLMELEDLKPLLEKGHVTQREFEKAENESIAARETLEIARAELNNFDKYEWPRIVREAEVILDAAAMELARVQRTTELEEQQQLSKVEKYRRDLEIKKKERKKAQKELEACDIYAPASGILLYADLPQQGKKRSVQIGDSIWQGQTLLEVPDTSNLVVEINIREIDVAKLSLGMPAEIVLDAYPGKVFQGTLAAIDALAQEDDSNTSIRRFFAKIKILESGTTIHVGMSAGVKIIYRELRDVIAVPACALSYRDGKTMVNLVTSNGNVRTEVSTGESGLQWVEILDGLAGNETIVAACL